MINRKELRDTGGQWVLGKCDNEFQNQLIKCDYGTMMHSLHVHVCVCMHVCVHVCVYVCICGCGVLYFESRPCLKLGKLSYNLSQKSPCVSSCVIS